MAKNGRVLDLATFPATEGDRLQAEKLDSQTICQLEEMFLAPAADK